MWRAFIATFLAASVCFCAANLAYQLDKVNEAKRSAAMHSQTGSKA